MAEKREKNVTFILGPAGSGKTHQLLSTIAARINSVDGTFRLLLVPDQATAIYERALLAATGKGIISNAAVTGFARLSHVLPLNGWTPPTVASQSVRRMMLFKALVESNEDGAVPKAALSVGTLDQALDFIDEIRRSGSTPSELLESVDEPERPWLNLKLGDVANAAISLERAMEEAGMADALGAQASFARHIAKNAPSVPFELYIDGFSSFPAIEMRIIESLIAHAEETHIALLIEPSLLEGESASPDTLIHESILGHTIETYLDLDKLISKLKLPRKYVKPDVSGNNSGRFKNAPGLLRIERRLAGFSESEGAAGGDSGEPITEARIIELPSRAAEVRFAAREIRRLVHSGERYRDISVLTRSITSYRDLITRTFERFDIPIFLDEPASIASHPAVRMVLGIAAFCVEASHVEILSLARNPLLGFDIKDADILENVILRLGIHAEELGSDYSSSLLTSQNPELEHLDEKLLKPLAAIRRELGEQNTAAKISDRLLGLIAGLNAQANMAGYAASDDSLPEQVHREAWDAAMEALSAIAGICGASPVSVSLYRDFIRAALTAATAKITPPALDQITVSDVERGRQMNPKHVFVLGLLEGEFPRQQADSGVLSQDERLYLREKGIRLINDGIARFAAERYYFYIASTRASNSLTITIPIKESADAVRSSFIPLLTGGGFIEPIQLDAPETPDEISDAVTVYESARILKSKGLAVSALQTDSGGGKLGELASLLALKPPDSFTLLTPPVNEKRLGGYGGVSATRLELLAKCRFAHFAQYDLRLEERKEWKVDPLDVGTIYHRALELALIESKRRNIGWRDGDRSTLKGILAECFKDALHDPEADWSKNPAIKLVEKRLWNSLSEFFSCSLDALAAGVFEPAESELEFGEPRDGDKRISLKLKSNLGKEYFLRGKIDRIDKSLEGNLIAVVDYKSSSRGMNWEKLYFGLGVQIALYGYAVIKLYGDGTETGDMEKFDMFGESAPVLAGVFTHGIDSEIKNVKSRRSKPENSARSKLRGIINSQHALAFDRMPASGRSSYFSFGTRKDGGLRADSHDVLSVNEWSTLFDWFGGKLVSLLGHLDEGEIAVTPVRLGGANGFVSCTYCPYGAVCRVKTARDVKRLAPPVDEKGNARKKGVLFAMRSEMEGEK